MLYTLENFNAFRDACHNASRDVGWWDTSERYWMATPGCCFDPDRLTIPTKLCLVHSEISEAYIGYMNGANDDHLPQYPSAAVEFGDVLIRIGDLAGYLKIDMNSAIAMVLQADHMDGYMLGAQHAFNRLHAFTSAAMEGYRRKRMDDVIPAMAALPANLARVVILCHLIALKNEWDLPVIAEAKMNYNAVREDHKREARAAEGGKVF